LLYSRDILKLSLLFFTSKFYRPITFSYFVIETLPLAIYIIGGVLVVGQEEPFQGAPNRQVIF